MIIWPAGNSKVYVYDIRVIESDIPSAPVSSPDTFLLSEDMNDLEKLVSDFTGEPSPQPPSPASFSAQKHVRGRDSSSGTWSYTLTGWMSAVKTQLRHSLCPNFTFMMQRQLHRVLQQGLEDSVRRWRQETRIERDGTSGHFLHHASLHWQPVVPIINQEKQTVKKTEAKREKRESAAVLSSAAYIKKQSEIKNLRMKPCNKR